jgi:hypothetical protein
VGKVKGEPLVQLLRAKALRMQALLLDLIEYWHYANSILLPKTEEKYRRLFGKFEAELDAMIKASSRIEQKLNSLYDRAVKGNPATTEAFRFVFHFNENKPLSHCCCSRNNAISGCGSLAKQDVADIKRKYYSIVKCLHPDASNNATMFSRFWNILVLAYKNSDYFLISQLYNAICFDICRFYSSVSSEEKLLTERLMVLESSVTEMKQKIKELFENKPLLYIRKLDDPIWIKKKRKELINKILHQRSRLKLQQRAYAAFKVHF